MILPGSMRVVGIFVSALAFAQTQNTSFLKQPLEPMRVDHSGALLFESPVADFSQQDLTGRTWRVADFRDKFTVLLIWSTSLPTSTMLLPEAQRFYEETKDSKKLRLLTLRLDADRGALSQYVQQHHYTFPVLYGWHLADSLRQPSGPLPAYLVVDSSGRRSNLVTSWSFGRLLYEAERLAK